MTIDLGIDVLDDTNLTIVEQHNLSTEAFIKFDNAVMEYKVLDRVQDYIRINGVTEEVIYTYAKELAALPTQPVLGVDGIPAMESFIAKAKAGRIKEAIADLIEALIRIWDKTLDTNKLLINKLTEAMLYKVRDTTIYDEVEFQATIGTMFPFGSASTSGTLPNILAELSSVDFFDIVEMKDIDDTLEDSIPLSTISMLKNIGYVAKDNLIYRDPEYKMPRGTMATLGYSISEVTKIVTDTHRMMNHMRDSATKTRREFKSAFRSVTDTDALTLMKKEMVARHKIIVILERVSILLTRHVLTMVNSLVEKK